MGLLKRRPRHASPEHPKEVLGTVSCPTGDLLVFDFGRMELWSGDEPPLLEGGTRIVPPDLAVEANESADFEIVGPDADTVAQRIDLAAVHGRYGFDLPADSEVLTRPVAEVCEAAGLRAEVRRIHRMPHRHRLQRLLDDHPDGVEVPFHGMWGVAATHWSTRRGSCSPTR